MYAHNYFNYSNCRSDEGPTVLLIKDKQGYIYGGYASQPWERHGDFYGDLKSFLFQLYPKAAIFRPTGANSNLQWVTSNENPFCIFLVYFGTYDFTVDSFFFENSVEIQNPINFANVYSKEL